MKTTTTSIIKAVLITSLLTLLSAQAQISVFAKPTKPKFVAHEPAKISITISNRAGQDILFRNTFDTRWIEFVVENAGRPAHAGKAVAYKSTLIGTGKTVTTTFTINNAFDLSQPGNYSCYAIVRMPGQKVTEGIRSNRVNFNIIRGYVSWKQKAGVPGKAGNTREYRIMNVTSKENTQLYVQVEDVKKGRVLATYSMGQNLSFRKFSATVDRASNLHVLFLTTPTLHCHTIVNPVGKTIRREYHKAGPGNSVPTLITTATGTVGVTNSTLYDPAKIAEQRRKIHNLSEVPFGL